MTTQTEIEAAVEAITAAEIELAVGKLSAETYATLALEAAERVRPPRRDPTNALRQRRYKAKRRNVTASEVVPGHVTEAAGPETANVPGWRPRLVTLPVT